MSKLTVIVPGAERQVEQMMGKAMCAYANLKSVKEGGVEYGSTTIAINRLDSELEATERCIAMFVKESMYEIGSAVIEQAEAEFGC